MSGIWRARNERVFNDKVLDSKKVISDSFDALQYFLSGAVIGEAHKPGELPLGNSR